MATEHFCKDKWRPGKVDSCDKHGQRVRNVTNVRYGRKTRRKMDKETGEVGIDRGGFISGT